MPQLSQAMANKSGYANGGDRRFEPDADGILAAWKECVYAETKDEYHKRWQRLNAEFPEQTAIIEYINATYNCWVEQFAQWAVKQHRNYGLKVTSRVESQHSALKRHLRNRLADLDQLHNAIKEMLRLQEVRWLNGISNEKEKHITAFEGDACLRLLWSKAAHRGIQRIKLQLIKARQWLKDNYGDPPPDGSCTGAFTQQFALPCWHRLAVLLSTGRPCLLTELGQFYWYEPHVPVTEEETLLRLEQDPLINPSRAMRRQNQNSPTPTLWLRSVADGESTSHRRDLSHDEPSQQRPAKRSRTQNKAPTMKNLMEKLISQQEILAEDRRATTDRFSRLESRLDNIVMSQSQMPQIQPTVFTPNPSAPPPSNPYIPWTQSQPPVQHQWPASYWSMPDERRQRMDQDRIAAGQRISTTRSGSQNMIPNGTPNGVQNGQPWHGNLF